MHTQRVLGPLPAFLGKGLGTRLSTEIYLIHCSLTNISCCNATVYSLWQMNPLVYKNLRIVETVSTNPLTFSVFHVGISQIFVQPDLKWTVGLVSKFSCCPVLGVWSPAYLASCMKKLNDSSNYWSINPQVTFNVLITVFESLFLPYHPPAKVITIDTGLPRLTWCHSSTVELTVTDLDLAPVLGLLVSSCTFHSTHWGLQ